MEIFVCNPKNFIFPSDPKLDFVASHACGISVPLALSEFLSQHSKGVRDTLLTIIQMRVVPVVVTC